MKAKNISGQAPGGKRTKLADILPLDTPMVVQIFPIYACNFRCNYCIFSVEKEKRGFISDKVNMDFDLYKKVIDDIFMFPSKVKVLRFVGIGEPLLYSRIANMIEYAASKKVANKIEILTNASLLTPKMSDSLIAAGLLRLVVSLQGTSRAKYHEVCGKDVDFYELLENLKYFFKNKGDVQMYLKIVDAALDGPEDEQRFYDLFEDICDTIAIEHAVPIHAGIEFNDTLKNKTVTQFGLPISDILICPQPFFTLQVNPDGKVVPCYSFEYPEIMGDCNRQSVPEIWNGASFQRFRLAMLNGSKNECKVCKECNIINYRMFPEDDLTNDTQRLKKIYEQENAHE